MAIIVKDKGGGNYPKPNPGMHQAVCSNVYGPYRESYEWGGKTISANKIIIMYEIEDRIQEGEFAGKRFTSSGRFTASLYEKAKLRPFLVAWRGLEFTPDELESFDVEKLIGANAYLNLVKKPKKGGGDSIIIASIMPIKSNVEKMIPELPREYMPKWVKDLMGVETETQETAPDSNDDIPF